jgi:hypothetical protein
MPGINIAQLKSLVIAPTLAKLGPVFSSPTAVNLLAGTCLVESGGMYIQQLGAGGALGLWQMETETHNDCYTNFLNHQSNAAVRGIIASLTTSMAYLSASEMVGNLYYACAMARIKYYRASAPLPAANDALGLANYHKDVYNTCLGATVVAESVSLFEQAIAA